MDYLPIFTKLQSQPCLVVGAGEVAIRKIHLLLRAGAQVTVCGIECRPEIAELAEQGKLTLLLQAFDESMVAGVRLVIAATDSIDVNKQVAAVADAQGIFVNVINEPEQGSFVMPSIVDRSPMLIAISSAGHAPVLARMIREKLEGILPKHIGPLTALAGQFRETVKQQLSKPTARRRFWETLFSRGEVASLLEKGQNEQAQKTILSSLQGFTAQGEVALVGAGPGDPSLITLKALQLMQQADVVLFDQLVSAETLELVRKDAKLVNVGKEAGKHSVIQEKTNELLVQYAKAGKKVVRLKGGDPFIFGRGGEELEELIEHQIPFQVVPGVTAASGCASYGGIPLTHRDYAQSVVFVTGHNKAQGAGPNWATLAQANQTCVFYMGLLQSAKIQQNLIEAGRAASTPVAIVSKGTRQDQQVITGQLSQLVELSQGVQPPALIIVGEVVSLADKLAWFGQQADAGQAASSLINLA